MVKYLIEYQHMPAGSTRPLDDGEIVGIEASDSGDFAVLPNVGDYVSVDNSGDSEEERPSFSGKVRSRLFRYIRTEHGLMCLVNIVVEDTKDDWGKLVKE